jgi:2-polyprenyl-3-methyl-5-hydroxy-6-metoxy-1,4-benzoquinol methylase
MYSQTIESTLVRGACARLVRLLSTSKIVEGYRGTYGIDVSKYFADDELPIYECEATTYRFFHPPSLAGREELYRQLEKFDWIYKPDKWEYQRALHYISGRSKVLDVGCGPGHFLILARRAGHVAYGLELNTSAVNRARADGLMVSAQSIGDHPNRNLECYDAVCSFQVLEHIYDVRSFITDCLRTLKPNGLLIFGVPNNAGFVGYDDLAVLNRPPHHMGLWSPTSLSRLAGIFGLDIIALEPEPLAEIDWYCKVIEQLWLPQRWQQSVYYRSGCAHLFRSLVRLNPAMIQGHTILAVYAKRPF